MVDRHLLVFGASITYGAWDLEGGGWAQRLRRFSDEKRKANPEHYLLVYNCGVSGDTSEDLLARFEVETKARLDPAAENMFLLTIGGNDSEYVNKEKRFNVEPEAYRKNVQKLIKLAQKSSSKIFFLGFPPCDEAKVDPIPWAPEKSYRNEDISKYNGIARDVCEAEDVPFLDIFDRLMEAGYAKTLGDGIHPDDEGHKMIFELVRDFLIKQGVIPK